MLTKSRHDVQTLTFAIYSLCDHPEYIEPLREEMESAAGGEFFVQGEGLPLMDSFLKECSRWTPVESGTFLSEHILYSLLIVSYQAVLMRRPAVTARRCALKDFTFSDGTRVAKGEWVGIPVGPMLRDPSMYPQPDVFDGFRFVDQEILERLGKTSIQPEGPSKFTDVSETWHVWGTGKLTWYVNIPLLC